MKDEGYEYGGFDCLLSSLPLRNSASPLRDSVIHLCVPAACSLLLTSCSLLLIAGDSNRRMTIKSARARHKMVTLWLQKAVASVLISVLPRMETVVIIVLVRNEV